MADFLLLRVAENPSFHVGVAVAGLSLFVLTVFGLAFLDFPPFTKLYDTVDAYARFCWACFMKPHAKGSKNQQDALENFYKAQASVYDKTRGMLLHGREDLLGLVASQLKNKALNGRKPIWVDMGEYVEVPNFFKTVYLVDLSTSLCEVAEKRFEALGWSNVKVICQDARAFNLSNYEEAETPKAAEKRMYGDGSSTGEHEGADLITMSYALSMIPEFYPVIDSLTSLLSINGIIGVVDFYVQSEVDFQSRNYTGGVLDRHCTWLSRTFWRTWFEIDRVNLEAARRDYLEYRFGTILTVNERNHSFGVRIPYYIWVGCSKERGSTEKRLAEIDAAATESPFLSALDLQTGTAVHHHECRSKAYESAIVNLTHQLPLPASWYQNHHWRIYYDDSLEKHKQFKDEYIYAFTWEDSRVDARLLNVQADDVVLAITSAGDNILSFAAAKPRRIHAVDLNPAQNHLLELKIAAFSTLSYSDVWKLFGEGKHEDFRELLVHKLSPHMSSLAFQYWLHEGPKAFKRGLYYTGGSRHALQLAKWLFRAFGMRNEVKALCEAQTLNEQREIWNRSLRKVLLNRTLSRLIVGKEKWLWKALGVPTNQRALIVQDFANQDDAVDDNGSSTKASESGHAIWEYAVNTLDPVINTSLLSEDNSYYLLCLQGHYSRKCHPEYLTPKAHIKLSHPNAFDGLRIHTDELHEVITRMSPGTLTIAVVMDSMDWFDPAGTAAAEQVAALNHSLKMKGRVLLRSAGLAPWYIRVFEEHGFQAKRVAARLPGTCIDRVNMYASTWICTKVSEWTDKKAMQKDGMGKPMTPLEI
ncbi:betaine lipid synthase [Rhizodiscina lignyota]|uniref:Betaine lipid synthase n=1 Tax=Rhizodiscina lignyota TaxID=1504668 RepID=A0A9P4IF17_9PEZI|nr:betaine lipid synthase [Rhizodiscina lignyota]